MKPSSKHFGIILRYIQQQRLHENKTMTEKEHAKNHCRAYLLSVENLLCA